MILLFLHLMLFTISVEAQSSIGLDRGTISINISNINKSSGNILLAVYNNEKGFRDPKQAYLLRVLPLTEKSCTTVLENLPEGNYSITVFHDLNSNGKIDMKWAGIPIEPYGFSKNPKIMFGPPSFEETAVLIREESIELKIILK